MFYRLSAALLGAVLLSNGLAQTPAPASSAERTLLERVLGTTWGPTGLKTSILVKQVPSTLGIALPAGSQVIGSVSTQAADPAYPSGTTVYFDTALSPKDVTTYFAKVLTQQGWKPFPQPGMAQMSGGFQSSAAVDGKSYYRQNPDEQLNIGAQVVGKVTQVTLSRQRSSNLENMLRYARNEQFDPAQSLPKLSPPAGAVVSPRGGGSSGNDVTQYATIESSLSRTALLDHYAGQLKKAGWTLRNRSDAGTMSSSLWSFTKGGKEQIGILILAQNQKGIYQATLGTQGSEY
ncbi:hypothetical protein ACINK0_14950 [Deinococcus sp. VB343]|uniref:Lipoprotein n=1 Tax=Deinococcus sp. VB142 TaxID=3112952 RepID=A0AAU6Q6M4_9DEIO